MTPVTGFHSTIDSPDSVSRVAPPTSTIANTSTATQASHTPTARDADGLFASAGAAMDAPSALEGQRRVMEPAAHWGSMENDPSSWARMAGGSRGRRGAPRGESRNRRSVRQQPHIAGEG